MSKLTLDDLGVVKMMKVGDALLRQGDYRAAADVYRQALADAGVWRNAVRVRQGFMATPPDMALGQMLDLLEAVEQIDPVSGFVGQGLATWQKLQPFQDDARFVAITERHAGLLPARNWQWNLQTAVWAAQRSLGVPGDFVELGVFKGHTTLVCAEYLDFQDQPKRWMLYDTFDGIPNDQLDPGWAQVNEGLYRSGSYGYEEVKARFAPFPNIEVIQGRVPEALADSAPETVAFLHVDLNNSTAEIAALDALFDRVSPGGIILFDDYGWRAAAAQHEAERAWFAARGEQVLPLPTGQGLFVKR